MAVIAALTLQTGIAQTDNYPELYRSLNSMNNFEAYLALFQYLKNTTSKEFVNANAYYQVGLFMQKSMNESDPFLNSRNMQDYIVRANLYFSLAKSSLNERDFRRQTSFYTTVKPSGQKLTTQDVIRDIDERLVEINAMKENFNESLSYLVKSVNFYNSCITTFGEINQQNSRLNDLYFLVNDSLKNRLTDLGVNFDSTLFYLDKLKDLVKQHPIGEYKFNYALKKIPVYRLYGLNSSDFLSENISLWDFRSWVNDFNEILDTDVAFLYKSAQEANSTNTDYIKRLLNMNTSGIAPNYKVNPLIINKMMKYDFNSATAALLIYQESKINYLYNIADSRAGNDLASFDRFTKSPDAFLNIVREKQKVEELLANAKEKATPESIEKYAKFFEDNYGEFSDYESFLNQQSDENEAVMKNALNAYKDRILRSYMSTGGERTVFFKDEPIYFQLTSPDQAAGKWGYLIHSKSQMPNQAMFIAGTHSTEKQKIAFAAVIDSTGTVRWLKELGKVNTVTHAMLTAVLSDGFAVVVSSPSGDFVRNQMLLLDAAGNTKTTKNLIYSSVPQKLVYDDIAQNYVIAFKGISFKSFIATGDELFICMLDEKLETRWSTLLGFDGYLANIIKTDDIYYVYGAQRTENDRMNMFVHPVTADGTWLTFSVFNAPFSYYPLYVSKINNEYVDVISVMDVPANRLVEERSVSAKPYYMIIHANQNIYYRYSNE